MGVAAIEACYVIPIDAGKGLPPSQLLTLAFSHATKSRINLLKVFVLAKGKRFRDVVESFRVFHTKPYCLEAM